EDGGDGRVDAGVPHRDMKDVVAPDLLEILGADKMTRNADLGVGHRQPHAFEEWVSDEQSEEGDRRQQQGHRQPALVLEHPGDRPTLWAPGVYTRGSYSRIGHLKSSRTCGDVVRYKPLPARHVPILRRLRPAYLGSP